MYYFLLLAALLLCYAESNRIESARAWPALDGLAIAVRVPSVNVALPLLRSWVGTLHRLRPLNSTVSLVILHSDFLAATASARAEIGLWDAVQLQQIVSHNPPQSSLDDIMQYTRTRLPLCTLAVDFSLFSENLLDDILRSMFIKGHAFATTDRLIANISSLDFTTEKLFSVGVCKSIPSWIQQSMLNLSKQQPLTFQSTLSATAYTHSQNCHISLNRTALTLPLLQCDVKSTSMSESNSTKIALLVATRTPQQVSIITRHPLYTILFPSLARSISKTEASRYRYTVYLGYDVGDHILDVDRTAQDLIIKILASQLMRNAPYLTTSQLDIQLVRFVPPNGWVTYIWNGLFTCAAANQADYFYQINDDLIIPHTGWTTDFIQTLSTMNDIGVVGPYDPILHGRLLTQAFVSRRHLDLFNYLYPPDIKNWYSDNWITSVYQNRTKILANHTIINTNQFGTRYTACDQRALYEYETQQGIEKLRMYLNNNV